MQNKPIACVLFCQIRTDARTTRRVPRVKFGVREWRETGYPASRVASIFPRKIEGDSVRRVERGKSPWVNTGRKFAGKVYDDAQTMEHFFL